MKRIARQWAIDCFLIFLLTGVLIKPLFKVKYLDKWDSIESTFISDARFLAENWPHPNWQPLWYCGTRFDYVYPPMLRYGTAGLTKLFPILPVRAYHIYTAFFYCLGIVGVYFFVRIGSGSRGGAWLAAAGAALLSPAFLFLTNVRADAWLWVPQRLGVLVRYGEGPHMTALAWLPIGLGFAYRALLKNRPVDLALAAAGCAMVVSNNFYGATSLAVIFPILVWSLYITQLDMKIWWRALAIILLAYGLTAFWLVPSYLRITLTNMQFVSEKGNAWSIWVGLAVAITYILLSDKYARGKSAQAYTVLVTGMALFFTMNVLGQYYFNFRIIGEPSRMVPELDLG
jgi:Predicted integral membrane protein